MADAGELILEQRQGTTIPRNFLPLDYLGIAVPYRFFIRRITATSSSISGSNAACVTSPAIQGVCYTIIAALPVWFALTAISWFLVYAGQESTESSIADANAMCFADVYRRYCDSSYDHMV